MSKFAKGGWIPGGPTTVSIRHLGHTADGTPVVSIEGGRPEMLWSAKRVRQIGSAWNAAFQASYLAPVQAWENEGGAL